MRFKKGETVEVLKRKKDPCGSWFPGKIISVDGDNYTVRYELHLDFEGKPIVEKVHAEDVRPQPPPAQRERWMLGDIVEVFDGLCWTAGKVAKVLMDSRFVIRIFGSIQLKEFHKSSLRIRQAWHKNTWSVIGKVGINEQSEKNRTCLKYSQGEVREGPQKGTCMTVGNGHEHVKGDLQENFNTSSVARPLKRDWNCCLKSHPNDPLVIGGGKRRKATKKLEGSDRLPRRILLLVKQVSDTSYQKVKVGENCVNRSFQLDLKTEEANHPYVVPVRDNEVSNECSVSSCNSNDLAEYTAQNSQTSSRFIADGSSDDAESSCPSFSRCQKYMPSCSNEDIEADIRKLELHAYRSTMQALFVSGPLSWEQESLLTNLRLSLNISNDEHLLQLRHLLSAQVL